MTTDLYFLIYSTILTWIMLIFTSFTRAKIWTVSGILWGMGNRDQELKVISPYAMRSDRATKNMLENLLLFVCLLAAIHFGQKHNDIVDTGAQIFFYARVFYFLVYVIGIPYLRSIIWGISILGLAMIGLQAF